MTARHTREIIYNFMRLRALRVEVDVAPRARRIHLEQAAKYLEEKSADGSGTAPPGSDRFSTAPGQAITYQNRQTPDQRNFSPKPVCSGANKIQPPRLPRFRLEKTATSDRLAEMGIL